MTRTNKNLQTIDCERLMLDTVGFNDGHFMAIDREDIPNRIVKVCTRYKVVNLRREACSVDKSETVTLSWLGTNDCKITAEFRTPEPINQRRIGNPCRYT